MKYRELFCLAILTTGACHPSLVRLPEREADSLGLMNESPIFLELPEDEPAPGMHATRGFLRIGDDTPYSLSFRGTPLRAALDDISARAGVTLFVDQAVAGTVDVDFVDISLDDVLLTLLKQNELVLLPGPGNVYFVERKDDPAQVTEFIQLVNVRAADVSANLEALVSSDSRVIADNDRNLICLVGSQSDVAAVRTYLHHVDTLKDQVLIEVHIFEVSYEDGFDFGSIYDIQGSSGGNAVAILSSLGQGSPFTASLTDPDGTFAATLDALRSFIGIELISSPRVLAVTNTKALVDVVQEIPYIETTSTTSGTTAGVGSTIQESVQFKEAGIKLEITPSIQEAGFLQIDIMQAIIEEVDRFNDIPVVDRRTLATQFLVKDRETVVLGGLIQSRHTESQSGIPILMHIPILGQLFRGDSEFKQKQEILLFVTPRILSPSQASKLAGHYQSSYRETRKGLGGTAESSDD